PARRPGRQRRGRRRRGWRLFAVPGAAGRLAVAAPGGDLLLPLAPPLDFPCLPGDPLLLPHLLVVLTPARARLRLRRWRRDPTEPPRKANEHAIPPRRGPP